MNPTLTSTLRQTTNNNVQTILFFGYILDALVVTGVIVNFLVFLLSKTTKLNPQRTAISVFAVVQAVLLLLIVSDQALNSQH